MAFSRQDYWSGLPLPSPLFTLGGFQYLIRVTPSMGVPLMQLPLVEYTVGFLTSSLSGHPPLCTWVRSHHTMLVLCEDDLFLCLGCRSLFSITIICWCSPHPILVLTMNTKMPLLMETTGIVSLHQNAAFYWSIFLNHIWAPLSWPCLYGIPSSPILGPEPMETEQPHANQASWTF